MSSLEPKLTICRDHLRAGPGLLVFHSENGDSEKQSPHEMSLLVTQRIVFLVGLSWRLSRALRTSRWRADSGWHVKDPGSYGRILLMCSVCKGTRRKRSTRRKRWYADHDEPSDVSMNPLMVLDSSNESSAATKNWRVHESKICTPGALVNPQHSWGLWMFFPKKKLVFQCISWVLIPPHNGKQAWVLH